MFISFSLAAFIIVAVQPVTADLNCDFARGACDWRQLKSNCSWGVSSKRGLAFVQNYCANATLKANIGWHEKKDLQLKYYMNGQGNASLTLNAGVGNGWWDAKPVEVYSCEQPMGTTWNIDRIRLPENTQYVTIEAVISKDAKYIIAVDQIKTGNFESGQEFVKMCTSPSATTKSLLTTTSIQMNTSNQADVATTTRLTKPTHKNVTSTTSPFTTITTLSPTTIYSRQTFYESGRKYRTTPQQPFMEGGRHTTPKVFMANSFTTNSSTTTLPLTTTESLTTLGSTRTNKATSLPQTEIYRKPVEIRKDKYETSTEIITITEPIAEAMIKTKSLSTSSLQNPTEGTTTTEATTTSEPTTTTEIKTSTEPTTTTKVTTASKITTTTDHSTTSSQMTTQPSTTKKTVTTTTSPKIITAYINRASVWNGKFFRPKTVSITRRKTTAANTRKTISTAATITTKFPTTPQTTTTTTTTSKTTTTAKPTEYWEKETTTLTSRLIITPNIFRPSIVKTTTILSEVTDECLYCFNETDSVLNATAGRPFDSDATIEHLSTIVVVASFFAILLIYALLKFLISSLVQWRKKVKVDKNEKDLPHSSSPISAGRYTVDDTGLNGQNEAVSGSIHRTRQESIYHMELPSQN